MGDPNIHLDPYSPHAKDFLRLLLCLCYPFHPPPSHLDDLLSPVQLLPSCGFLMSGYWRLSGHWHWLLKLLSPVTDSCKHGQHLQNILFVRSDCRIPGQIWTALMYCSRGPAATKLCWIVRSELVKQLLSQSCSSVVDEWAPFRATCFQNKEYPCTSTSAKYIIITLQNTQPISSCTNVLLPWSCSHQTMLNS